jgi:hypothetical protein
MNVNMLKAVFRNEYSDKFNARYPNYPESQMSILDTNFLTFVLEEDKNRKWQRQIFKDFLFGFIVSVFGGHLAIRESGFLCYFYGFMCVTACILSSHLLYIWCKNRWWLKRPLLYSEPLAFKRLQGSLQTLYYKSP